MMNLLAFSLLLASTVPVLPPEIALLQGCWSGTTADGHIEERYGDTGGNLLLGHVKEIHDGKVRFFEFLRIFADADGTWLQPYPRGRADAPRFRLVASRRDELVFENDKHDFPRRIVYRLLQDGELLTRVSGVMDGAAVEQDYRTHPTPCRE